MRHLFFQLRPHQWVKNGLIFFPLVFSSNLTNFPLVCREILAFVSFCLVASSVYILNDIVDLPLDRLHPIKKTRPLACGKLKMAHAILILIVLLGVGLSASLYLSVSAFWLAIAYFALNICYTLYLKQVHPVDIVLVAFFYMMRPVYGAAAIQLPPTHWLILTTFFAALYLVSLKRRAEWAHSIQNGHKARHSLDDFNPKTTQTFGDISLAVSLVCYAIYAGNFPHYFVLSTVVIVAIAYRTLLLSQQSIEQFEFPEKALLRDPMVLTLSLLWAGYVIGYHLSP